MNYHDILVPDLPESVIEATILTWHKKIGDILHANEILVEIETDKVVLEIPAPSNGILISILEKEGSVVTSKQVIGQYQIKTNPDEISYIQDPDKQTHTNSINNLSCSQAQGGIEERDNNTTQDSLAPSIRAMIKEYNLDPKKITGTGKSGRITRLDIENYLESIKTHQVDISIKQPKSNVLNKRDEKRVPMTRIRKRIAERLLETKTNTAMLTTFNEVNMKPIIDLRKQYGELFEKIHGIRLGFMSFYVKAVVESLKRFPEINAYIDGDNIIYHNYYDISIAVSTPRGLVTPVLKNAELISIPDIEKKIKSMANKAREGKLTVDEIIGGTFTITNGGVFGSLISTPLLNPPQTAILGMHVIKERPVAVEDKVVILPMMYLALSYDHRLIDGRESISFLLSIKDTLEDPARLLLEI
ncbi:MAG: 2-oxoglutarate dehydrogenase complex dihydrolipoyllysine-residue succinyltransferase [Candidatus Dasytiphilus stammeri]